MSAGSVSRPLIAMLVASLVLAVTSAGPVAAQTAPGPEAGIVATGYGRASAPATSASVQIIVSRDAYGGYGVVEMMPPVTEQNVDVAASPVAGQEDPGMMEGDPGMVGPVMPSPLTDADLVPIVDAVVAAGVAQDQITVLAPNSFSSFTGIGGPQGADIRFSVAEPVVADLVTLVQSAQQAALDAGLGVTHVGVQYLGDDCVALEQQARTAAVADARERAAGLAEALGEELGDLVQAADGSLYYGFGPYGNDPALCVSQVMTEFGYGPGVSPPFDPSQPAEVVIVATVTLTFAMGAGDSAA